MRVFVTGGTGYVGTAVLQALLGAGHDVTAAPVDTKRTAPRSVGSPPSANTGRFDVTVLEHAHPSPLAHPRLTRAHGDINDPASLRKAIDGAEAVVHLVAIRRGKPADFARTAAGARNVVEAAKESGARRFLLMSANGLEEGTTPYFAAKREMERAVKESGLAWTIFRPSYVASGEEGGFDHEFAGVVDKAPLLPSFAGGKFEIQPISRDDVALAFARALERDISIGKTYVLVGRERFTWNEYLRKLARVRGKRRATLIYVPRWAILLLARVLGRAFPASPDELRMLMQGSVGDAEPAARELGLPMVRWDDAVAGLARHTPR